MNQNKETLMIFDANNRAHAAYHAYKKLSFRGQGTSIIYGLPSMIKSMLFNHRPGKIVMIWDGNKSKHRKAVCPEYKEHRKKQAIKYNFDYEDFNKQKEIVKRLLYYMGIPQIYNPENEADDMIYKVVKREKKNWGNITIVSGDKDFHQLLDRNKVTIWNDALKNEITENNLNEFTNSKGQVCFPYTPEQTVDFLTLVGDDSDDIAGYPGIGPAKAMQLLNKYGSLEDFLDSRDSFLHIERTKLLAIRKRNQFLIDLAVYYRKHKDELKTHYYKGEKAPKVNKKKFLALANKYNMNRLLNAGFLTEFIALKINQG